MTQRSILITGCSSGIGLAAAQRLKERGWRVFAAARRTQDVEKLNELGVNGIQLDVTDSDSIRKAVDTVLQATGGTLDALFNNAGILMAGVTEDLSRDMIRQQFETNVFGPMELIRYILPVMRKQGHGRIVQNSSILGIMTIPYYGAYNASKYALEGFTLTLRDECRDSGIEVSLINPGPIKTELRSHAHDIYRATVANMSGTAHKSTYEKLEKDYFPKDNKPKKSQASPDTVVRHLIHALESKRPKIHYFVGRTAIVVAWLHKLLPERLFMWLISKFKG